MMSDIVRALDTYSSFKNIEDRIVYMQSAEFKSAFPDYGLYNLFIDEYRWQHQEYKILFDAMHFDKMYTKKSDWDEK